MFAMHSAMYPMKLQWMIKLQSMQHQMQLQYKRALQVWHYRSEKVHQLVKTIGYEQCIVLSDSEPIKSYKVVLEYQPYLLR